MSHTRPLAEHLLARARLMARVGRPADARRLLRRLLATSDLSTRARSDVFRQLAGIALAAGNFRRARRLMAAAIRLRRHADELYVEFARVVSADPDGDPRLAVKALRRAVGIDPFEVGSWAALGTAAGRAGEADLARKAFHRAARLRPDAAATLNEIVDGFVELGLGAEARSVLIAARFRSPSDAGVLAAWNRFRFLLAQRRQRQAASDEATILPFMGQGRQPTAMPGTPVVLRADRQSASTPHLLRMFGRRSDPRRAQ